MGHIPAPLGRSQVIGFLEADRAETVALCDRLSPRDLIVPGLGGGAWSVADLLGHLESWEEHALRALDAWALGEAAPIDRALRTEGLTAVNRAEVVRKAGRSGAEALRRAAATHASLIARIEALADDAWRAPATPHGRTPLGHRLGQILAGPRDPFRHDTAHLRDLHACTEERTR